MLFSPPPFPPPFSPPVFRSFFNSHTSFTKNRAQLLQFSHALKHFASGTLQHLFCLAYLGTSKNLRNPSKPWNPRKPGSPEGLRRTLGTRTKKGAPPVPKIAQADDRQSPHGHGSITFQHLGNHWGTKGHHQAWSPAGNV